MFEPGRMMLTPAEFRVLIRNYVVHKAESSTSDNEFYEGCANLLHRVEEYLLTVSEDIANTEVSNFDNREYVNQELENSLDNLKVTRGGVQFDEEPPL